MAELAARPKGDPAKAELAPPAAEVEGGVCNDLARLAWVVSG